MFNGLQRQGQSVRVLFDGLSHLIFNHRHPIFVGHPNSDHSWRMSAAGCCSARPTGHIRLRCTGQSLWFVGGKGTSRLVYIVHCKKTGCTAFCAVCQCLFSLRMIPLLWPKMTSFDWSRGWHSPSQLVTGQRAVSLPLLPFGMAIIAILSAMLVIVAEL